MSATIVHLIRHGEVDNPYHLVYADLPGYGLTATGERQAADAAARLAASPVRLVLSSPLLRAKDTAAVIAAEHGLSITVEDELTEWAGAMRWAGVRWDDLEAVFPGELDAYLRTPLDLPFASESLLECGQRVAAVVRGAAAAMEEGELVVVSHQDPIHSGHLALIESQPADYHAAKPAHAGVVTLRSSAGAWEPIGYWEPEQGVEFPPRDS